MNGNLSLLLEEKVATKSTDEVSPFSLTNPRPCFLVSHTISAYFITKYKEFINSIEQILAEERQHEAEKELKQNAKTEKLETLPTEDDNKTTSHVISEEELARQKAAIRIKLDRAIEAIEDFESDLALEILQSLRSPDADSDFMEALTKVSDLVDDFEYDEAVEILKKM